MDLWVILMAAGSISYFILIMLVSAGNLSEIILKEKESRTYFRMLSAPIDSQQYVLANTFAHSRSNSHRSLFSE
ncbi:hypothetical protein [Metabacillus sp. RGM 3146]|uniref:hypothetical protein n=1 Tax=Metabacillus sp. RGM 3146 TaxID=3401092 RepID=UPI003B9C97C0